jgi:hypothetical protein
MSMDFSLECEKKEKKVTAKYSKRTRERRQNEYERREKSLKGDKYELLF